MKHFDQAYPQAIIAELKERARRDADVVEVTRERTKEELDIAQAANPTVSRESLRYISETVGRLRGLYIFERSIRNVLVMDLENRLNDMLKLDKDKTTPRQLQEYYNWATGINDLFAEAELLISEGQVFFQRENLELLGYFPMNDKTRHAFNELGWNYEQGQAIEKKHKK